MVAKEEKISEDLKEEMYKTISEMVEEEVFESLESVKGDIDEFLRIMLNPEIKIDKFDQFTQDRINSLKEVFTIFKTKLKQEILEELLNSDFKKEIVNEIKKEVLKQKSTKGSKARSSVRKKKVVLAKPKRKTKIKAKKSKKS